MKSSLLGLLRFGALGGTTFATNIALTAFLHQVLGLWAEAAFAVSLSTAMIISFLACRYVIFKAGSEGNPKQQAVLFLLSSVAFRGAEYLGFLLLYSVLGVHYLAAITGILIMTFFAKFFYYRLVFGSVPDDISSVRAARR